VISKEEFFLEVVGSEGGYGLLDPTIVTDNFNSYNDGDLNGQGSWTAHANIDVQGTEVKEGTKAIRDSNAHTGTEEMKKSGSALADGKLTFYFQIAGSGDHNLSFYLVSGGAANVFMGFLNGSFRYHNGSAWQTGIFDYTLNAWHSFEIEWRASDDKARFRMDEDTWTDWVTNNGTWTTLDELWISFYIVASGQTHYIDYIAEDPISVGTDMQINIGDAWKAVELMKINIGDVWKDVSGAWVNIGDSWKVIY